MKVDVPGTIMLLVRIGEARVGVVFGFVKFLAVGFLLGTSFMDWFVSGILSTKRKIVLYNSQLVLIIMVHEASVQNQPITRDINRSDGSVFAEKAVEQEHIVRVARAMILQPMSETPVLLNTNASIIVEVDTYPPLGRHYTCKTVCGVIDVFRRRPFRNLIGNISSSATNLAKHEQVAITCQTLLIIIQNKIYEPFFYSVSQLLPDSVNVVHYKTAPTIPNKCINMRASNSVKMNASTTIGARK